MINKSFIVYTDYLDLIKELTDEERGKLFTGLLEYVKNKKIPSLKDKAKMIFQLMKIQIDINAERYISKKKAFDK